MTTLYTRNFNIDATEIDGEWVLLNAENFTVTKLSEVGGACWNLLGEYCTVESIIHELNKEYDITTEDAKKNVQLFIDELIELGLVTSEF